VNTKAKGSRNERRARRIFEERGFTVVRAGASLGVFDLVAFSRDGVVLAQVKTNRGPGRVEKKELRAFQNLPHGARKEVWIFRDRCAEPQIEVIP